jgi:hypothetical protein
MAAIFVATGPASDGAWCYATSTMSSVYPLLARLVG